MERKLVYFVWITKSKLLRKILRFFSFFYNKHFRKQRNNDRRDKRAPTVGRYECDLPKKAYLFRYDWSAGHNLVPPKTECMKYLKEKPRSILSCRVGVYAFSSTRPNRRHKSLQEAKAKPMGQPTDGPTDGRTYAHI